MYVPACLYVVVAVLSSTTRGLSQCPTTACTCEEVNGMKNINCRYKSLTVIPSFTSVSAVYDKIDFSSTENPGECASHCNTITSLPTNAFRNLKVKVIDLRNNAVASFDIAAFEGLQPYLEGLYIEGTGTIAPPFASISQLNGLKLLHMENFKLASMSLANAPLEFTNLEALTLENIKGLSQIEQNAFSRITNVKELTLNSLTSMTVLPVAAILNNLQKLTKLKIIDTSITKIHGKSFQTLAALTNLEIVRNHDLTDIAPDGFEDISDTLEFLSLQYSDLTDIDFFERYTWPQLTQLQLDYNSNLNVLPSKLSSLTKLQFLNLQDSGITVVDKEMFKGLSKLHTLDLSYNQISTVKADAFQYMPELTELKMINDQANTVTFEANAFETVKNSIQHLLLAKHNFDHTQFWNTIKRFHNLKELSVTESNIHRIPDYAFTNNEQLTKIEFGNNGITTINQETFYGPRNTLKSIDLLGNQITTLSKCIVHDFPNIPSITLRQNPIKCDCQMLWYYDWVVGITTKSHYVEDCKSPSSLQGTLLYKVQRSQLTCDSNYKPPVCSDLYATNINLVIGSQTTTTITVTWSVSDKSDITGYKLVLTSTYEAKRIKELQSEASQYTFTELREGNTFTICLLLEINNVYANQQNCKSADTTAIEATTQATATTTAEPDSQIGVIIGASVGAVVLIALVITIIVLLTLKKKHKRKPPPSPTMPVKFGKPMGKELEPNQQKKRYVQTPSNKGVTKPEDVNIKVISSGNMNPNDRVSAGSYQTLKEIDRNGAHKNTAGQSGDAKRPYVRTINERIPAAARYAAGKGNPYANTDSDGNVVKTDSSQNKYDEVKDTMII